MVHSLAVKDCGVYRGDSYPAAPIFSDFAVISMANTYFINLFLLRRGKLSFGGSIQMLSIILALPDGMVDRCFLLHQRTLHENAFPENEAVRSVNCQFQSRAFGI